MNYSVIWMPAAQQQLAALWLAATNRNAVTHASNAIDRVLTLAPHAVGVFLFDTVYEYTQTPLTVEYEVIDADMRVFVLNVWDSATGRPNPTGN